MPEDPNILIITLDSCRWDTFERARTPCLDSLCSTRKAYAQATFTYAAHLAIYQGHLPSTRDRIPYYNRFVKPLFRIANTATQIDSYITFPGGTKTIVHGFESLGYHTLGVGSTGWFRHPDLSSLFQDFTLTGIHAELQTEILMSKTRTLQRPFLAMWNLGETHEPYEFGRAISYTAVSRARSLSRSASNEGFDEASWLKQIKACEFLDARIGELVDELRRFARGTIVVTCADHGECFGEEGLYGHGFYHPKVMEVPLGIFEINCQLL